MSRPFRFGVLCVAVSALIATGCGGDDDTTESTESEMTGLDTAAIESTLEDTLGSSGSTLGSSSGPAITEVDCPDEVEPGSGTTFDCTLGGEDGLSGTVTVTLKDENGAKLAYKGDAKTSGFSTEVNGTVSTSGS